MRVYVVRKWPFRGRSRFVCWNITRVSLWLLCNVHFVQSTQRTRLQTRPFVGGINNLLKQGVCASRNQAVARLPLKNLNFVSICAVSPVVHTSKISSCQKKTISVLLWLWTIPLTLILLTWRMWWAPNNASKWQMKFHSAFKWLRQVLWFSCYKCL